MTDEQNLFEAIQAAEEVVYWARRFLATNDPEIREILYTSIEEFEELKT